MNQKDIRTIVLKINDDDVQQKIKNLEAGHIINITHGEDL